MLLVKSKFQSKSVLQLYFVSYEKHKEVTGQMQQTAKASEELLPGKRMINHSRQREQIELLFLTQS